ncbi:hypothetical protein GHT06_007995 [Daphnia sinensis]|uniref:Epidermal growth factor-like protein 7 n=1 Tax=Daphnia sinensis TaxID=1820382 RepID=A0AAD5PYK7_9CRUS|nr:hypothetical protein GHT06_007995 [Daphnia sinensis]
MPKIISLILLATAGTAVLSEGKWMTGTAAQVTKRSGTVTDLASIYDRATKHHPAIGNKRRHHTGRANGWTTRPDQHPVNNALLSSSTPSSVATEEEVDHLFHHQRNNKQDANASVSAQPQQTTPHPYNGRHVCTHEETITRPIRVVESYCKPAYKSFTQRCSNGTMCTAFRVQYDTVYRTVVKYQTTTEKKHACCPGWTHADKHTHGCLQAVCNKGCKNGGTCVKPNVCTCAPGYTGPSCESDLDECSAPGSNVCQQTCINSAGSYQCACHEGFQLQDDGRSCKFRLELIPELQTLLINYESMSKRLAVLEQEPKFNNTVSQPIHTAPQVDIVDYQSTIANMTDHILLLEEKLNKLQTETTLLIANSSNRVESSESSNSDSLESLSAQISILEERLADCTCTMSPSVNAVKMRP